MIRVAVFLRKMHAAGTKNVVMEYYRHIDKSKVQFDFIVDSDSNAIPEEEIVRLGGRLFKITPHEHLFGNMRDLYKLFRENNYQIIHAYDNTMNIFPMMVAKIAGVKVRISECLSTGNKNEWKSYIKMCLKPFSKCCANYYAACGEQAGVWMFGKRTFEQGKVTVFRTCVDARRNTFNAKTREVTRKRFNWDNKTVIGFIGRYEPQKNPLFLLDVFYEIQKRKPDAFLVMIGYGGMKKLIADKVSKMGIKDKFLDMGLTENIIPFYNAFDAFLLPSLYEGLPVVGFEAQCSGLPTFFSDEVTQEANVSSLAHFMSLKNSPEEWAIQVIDAINENVPCRKGHENDIIRAGYDSATEAKRLLDFYQHILNEQNHLS